MRDFLTPYWTEFDRLSLLAAIITGLLCLVLLWVPGLIHWLFQMESGMGADIMSRRAAFLFMGFSVILYRARFEGPSPLRASLAFGVAIMMAGLLLVGLWEFARGTVGLGIFLAIIVEAFFAAAFFKFWRRG